MTNKELEAYNKNRKIWQVCAITDNLEETLQQWVDRLKIGPWKVRSFNNENMDWMYLVYWMRNPTTYRLSVGGTFFPVKT